MKKDITLLITCAGGSLMPCVLVELMRSRLFKYRIIGVDTAPQVPAERMLSRFYQVPGGDHPEYVPALLDIVEQEKADVILPLSDGEAYAISGIAGDIESLGARALVSPSACLDLISDKLSTYRNIERAGLHAPRYTAVQTPDQLINALAKYDYPKNTVVMKPTKGRGNRGLHILCGEDNPPQWLGSGKREKRVTKPVDDMKLLASFMEGETLIMPCLGLPAYDADVLNCDSGKYAVYVRQRTNPTGIPYEGNTLTVQPGVTEYCRNVAEALNLGVLHDMDLMTDENGKTVILEVNPRPSGSIASTLVSGFPVLDWAVARILDIKIHPREPETDITVKAVSGLFALPGRPG